MSFVLELTSFALFIKERNKSGQQSRTVNPEAIANHITELLRFALISQFVFRFSNKVGFKIDLMSHVNQLSVFKWCFIHL
jgi:hypothetical protein